MSASLPAYLTLAGAIDGLTRRGFTEHLTVVGSKLQALESGRTFGPDEVVIREYHRFEGVSDPDDMSIVYAIESRGGTRGTLVDAFGVYSNPVVGAFLREVPIPRRPAGETKERGRPIMTYALWIVQGLLAALFLFAGGMKLVLPLEKLTGPVLVPGLFMRFIGVAEVLGALGLLLPGLLRIRPGLTPLAAAGLVIIMIGATVVTLVGRDVVAALISVVVGLLAAFVAYGRWRLAPHRGSSHPSTLEPAR